jgi:hypothetical protein
MSLEPYRDGDRVMVPMRAEDPATDTVGVGYVELEVDDPDYGEWVEYLRFLEGDWAERVAS